ncbi:hypothetical protein K431DRAFT_3116 [Polychaeton citri CBS 116435]|uniref:Copper-fist domain-containing protein n=1 Tax=Polychaeton citri CBS 116435 TaxID=1314669 RepID=A0A9P4UUU4_9PEZI|nr:hypothetical protein K431DRAFT_3116 [Polychaeton citri CBS 116435]
MVVREDGSKWACSSCLKGHRVSGCTHTDRELIHVPKKGRPVTQCQHCRQERKKRSAHVRCDCGEDGKAHHPKEKCIHLREAEDRQKKEGFHGDHHEEVSRDRELEHAHLAVVAEEQGCCCHHGGNCSCALLKKETAGDDGTPPHGRPAVQKPKLESTASDTQITIFQNGHHKPVHRKNHAAHESGMPYKLPMQRSHTDDAVARVARRSVDNLSLEGGKHFNPTSHPPPTSAPFDTGRRGPPNAGYSSNEPGKFGAELRAGLQSASNDTLAFPSLEPVSSVADSQFDPWSAFPSSEVATYPNNNPFGVWPTSSDISSITQPALTAASSGTQSEIDDLPPVDDFGINMPPSHNDIAGASYNLEPSASTEQQVNRNSLPPDFFSTFGYNMRMNSDSSQHFNGMAGISDNPPKEVTDGGQTFMGVSKWPAPSQSPVAKTAPKLFHRKTVGSDNFANANPLPASGRPASQSVGPANAPNDDLIKELFPDIDISGSASAAGGNATAATAFSPLATSTSNEYGGFDSSSSFTSPPWNGGEMSASPSNFDSPYDFNQNFQPQQAFPNWSQ